MNGSRPSDYAYGFCKSDSSSLVRTGVGRAFRQRVLVLIARDSDTSAVRVGDGVGAAGRTLRGNLDVLVRTAENGLGSVPAGHGGGRGGGHILLREIVLGRRSNLAHVGDASLGLGLIAVLDEVRDRDGGEDADDGDHDHDFNQGEALLELFHGVFPCVLGLVSVSGFGSCLFKTTAEPSATSF